MSGTQIVEAASRASFEILHHVACLISSAAHGDKHDPFCRDDAIGSILRLQAMFGRSWDKIGPAQELVLPHCVGVQFGSCDQKCSTPHEAAWQVGWRFLRSIARAIYLDGGGAAAYADLLTWNVNDAIDGGKDMPELGREGLLEHWEAVAETIRELAPFLEAIGNLRIDLEQRSAAALAPQKAEIRNDAGDSAIELDYELKARAYLSRKPSASIREIARVVGVAHTTLQRNESFMATYEVVSANAPRTIKLGAKRRLKHSPGTKDYRDDD